MDPSSVQPGTVTSGGAPCGVVWVTVSVTVGGGDSRSFLSWAFSTIRIAIAIASAPSTPAAHSSARWPDENVRRGGGGRCPPVTGRARVAGAVPHAGVLHQRDLDQLAHVGRQVAGQRGGCLLDVLHRDREGTVTGERPLA